MRKIFYLASLAIFGLSMCGRPNTQIEVRASGLTYSPSRLDLAAGTNVTLHFENTDSIDHDINIVPLNSSDNTRTPTNSKHQGLSHSHHHSDGTLDEGDSANALHAFAEPGGSATIDIASIPVGNYEFYCSVPGHREAGMKGELVVH